MALPATPTVVVIGSGAVGLYYGGRLAQHGLPVHFLARSDHDALKRSGLSVRSCHGDFSIPPTAMRVHRTADALPKADLVLVALKTTANSALPALLPPVLKSDTVVVTLQNGLGNEDAIAALHDPALIYGGIAFTCINRLPDASVHHSSHGLIRLGGFSPLATGNSQLATLFTRCNIRCEAIDNLMKGRWQKLIWNVPFNGLGAALDLATDQLLASREGTELVAGLMNEIMAAAATQGLAFEDPAGIVEHQLSETRDMARYHTSMQLDRRNGRPFEHEAIVGEPLRRGTGAGCAMPHTAHLYQLLCAVDGITGRRTESAGASARPPGA